MYPLKFSYVYNFFLKSYAKHPLYFLPCVLYQLYHVNGSRMVHIDDKISMDRRNLRASNGISLNTSFIQKHTRRCRLIGGRKTQGFRFCNITKRTSGTTYALRLRNPSICNAFIGYIP